jgi:Protein of unknown function (DUF3892)
VGARIEKDMPMATRRRIKCINKTDRTSAHERIKNVGGDWGKITVDQCIYDIENRVYEYYTHVGSNEVDVIVAENQGRKYVKTRNDGIQPDNLLSLPECP